jgi:hypothetical protein
MGEVVRELIKGINEAQAAIDAMEKRVDLATLRALKKAQAVAKISVRSGMRGRPRWDRRGAIAGGREPAVNLNLTPHHVSRSGGPGKLTGQLSAAVGVMKRPKKLGPASYEGGIGAGGKHSITRIYRKEVEARAPYIAPGVAKAEPKMGEVYKLEWAKATET